MSEYLQWCLKVDRLHRCQVPADDRLESSNLVERVSAADGTAFVRKTISTEIYIPRLKALGAVAYALLDSYLSGERVTPNVYAPAPNIIWREFLSGVRGDQWRADLYLKTGSIEKADELIKAEVVQAPSAERMALLDMIALYQGRSAQNWLKGHDRFWAIDNGILWPHRGRQVDRRAARTGRVDHLQPPIRNVLVYQGESFEFKSGVFSSVYAGWPISGDLLHRLGAIDWDRYFDQLGKLVCTPLGYPPEIIHDWRLRRLQDRAAWLVSERRFPSPNEIFSLAWQPLIEPPPRVKPIWRRQWEI